MLKVNLNEVIKAVRLYYLTSVRFLFEIDINFHFKMVSPVYFLSLLSNLLVVSSAVTTKRPYHLHVIQIHQTTRLPVVFNFTEGSMLFSTRSSQINSASSFPRMQNPTTMMPSTQSSNGTMRQLQWQETNNSSFLNGSRFEILGVNGTVIGGNYGESVIMMPELNATRTKSPCQTEFKNKAKLDKAWNECEELTGFSNVTNLSNKHTVKRKDFKVLKQIQSVL
jgi:hypothetical protein